MYLCRTQMQLESSFENYASATQQPSVILCDRGIMDGSAYIPVEAWETLLNEVCVCVCVYVWRCMYLYACLFG